MLGEVLKLKIQSAIYKHNDWQFCANGGQLFH